MSVRRKIIGSFLHLIIITQHGEGCLYYNVEIPDTENLKVPFKHVLRT